MELGHTRFEGIGSISWARGEEVNVVPKKDVPARIDQRGKVKEGKLDRRADMHVAGPGTAVVVVLIAASMFSAYKVSEEGNRFYYTKG